MQLSVIIPVCNEEENLPELYQRMTNTLTLLGRTYEIIFIDDASTDNSLNIIKSFYSKDPHVKILVFDRNYGQYAAFLAGIEYSQGEIIVTFHSDLQYAPEDIPKFVAKMDEGLEAVGGWRISREDSFFKKAQSFLFNQICYFKTGIKKHDYGCSFNALSRKTAQRLKEYGENARFVKLIVTLLVKTYPELAFRYYPREKGKSKYNLFVNMKLALDYIFHFSMKSSKRNKPLFSIQEILAK